MNTQVWIDLGILALIFICTSLGYYLGKYNQQHEDEMRNAIRRRNQIAMETSRNTKNK